MTILASEGLTYADAARMLRDLEDQRGLEWIYFIQSGDDGPVKIGVSANLRLRLRLLQTASPEKLHVRAVMPGIKGCEEGWLHQQFSDARIHGEWFEPVPELMKLVNGYAAVYDLERKDMLRERS